jgi:hypothetical protein
VFYYKFISPFKTYLYLSCWIQTRQIAFTLASALKLYTHVAVVLYYEEFEDTKGAIIIRISKKNSQQNGQKDKQLFTKHTYKTEDRVTRTPLKSGAELRCSGRVNSSFSMVMVMRSSDVWGRRCHTSSKYVVVNVNIIKLNQRTWWSWCKHRNQLQRARRISGTSLTR